MEKKDVMKQRNKIMIQPHWRVHCINFMKIWWQIKMLHWKLIFHGNQWYENNYYNNQNLYKNKTKEVLTANVKFKIKAIFFHSSLQVHVSLP